VIALLTALRWIAALRASKAQVAAEERLLQEGGPNANATALRRAMFKDG
jgi:hypothetical protein